jgi:hypothetical protein
MGRHDPNFRQTARGRISESRRAWTRTYPAEFVLYVNERDEGSADPAADTTPTIVLFFKVGAKAVYLDLTVLTAEELAASKKLIDLAFDEAKPVCEERDRMAEEAMANGDDTHARAYRAVPQFIDRKRSERPDGQGIHVRPEEPPAI